MQEYIDLSNIKEISTKTLKIYLYNPATEEILLDDLKLEMRGYKENKKFIMN